MLFIMTAKAFDCVDHSILISKLRKIGVSGAFLKWIISYLSNRFQAVKIRESLSFWFLTTSGVPQGSNLGPLLFLLLINDITSCVKNSHLDIFADDLRMYKSVVGFNDYIALQYDIDSIYQWSIQNIIDLSIAKCKVMTIGREFSVHEYEYKINIIVLTRTYVIKDLGIVFDCEWKINHHIQFITSKAFKLT